MELSLTPVLLAVELGFFFTLARHGARMTPGQETMRPAYVYFTWLAVYGIATSVIGAYGVYISESLLRLYPGFWLQLITVSACVAPVLLFPRLRNALRLIVDRAPWHWFAYFHAMRIAALGTAFKTTTGEFPLFFELIVGVPDLLFGFSALWIAWKAKRGEIGETGFMVWNLVGAFIIVPAAPIVLQLGLPGPLQVFSALPDARAVFTYPMSIAPMIGVPLFVLTNLWVAWRLWERQRARVAAA